MIRFLRSFFNPTLWPSRLLFMFMLFLILDRMFPLPGEKPMSSVVLAADGSMLSAYLSKDDKWRMKVDLDKVSPDLVQAILAKEDRWFYAHPGVNPIAIGRAAWNNLITGRRTSGASTITMQLARMMEPRPRTLWSKFVEVFRSFQLEWHYSKDEILEQYLTYLPYGGNVEGVKAASYLYFDRPPEALSLAQATMLTVIPNRPNSLRLDRKPEAAREARDKWLRRFGDEGWFPAADVQAALEEPVASFRHEIVPKAPHFSRYVHGRFPETEILTTLDPEMQDAAERLLARYVGKARHKGVTNGAVIILDNTTGAVRAYCGSADYYDVLNDGQVDGARAIRSPGSTLKPAVYAMALDLGLHTPHSRLLDIPMDFSGYAPDNYDEKFRGAVSLEYALRYSLNIPAVDVLNQVGLNRFLNTMEAAGFHSIAEQREKLGLSVVLGGCGVTLEELAGLFAAFANKGRARPPVYRIQDIQTPESGLPLFSPGATWMVTEIMRGIERPDIPRDLIKAAGKSPIAWKTGTSYGRRDAWSVGYSPRHTIAVWAGNFDGRGVADLSGATIAAPLLFELFDAIEKEGRKQFNRPPEVWDRVVCDETGDLPSQYCTRKVKDHYLPGKSPRRICAQEQELYVNADSSIQYCTGCLPDSSYLRAVYPVYPARLTLWLESNREPFRKPPLHNPDCSAMFDGAGPRILNPTPDYEYLVEKGSGQEILLQAASDARVSRHHWYVNGKFQGSVAPGEKLFFQPQGAGDFHILCMDDQGRQSTVDVVVRFY